MIGVTVQGEGLLLSCFKVLATVINFSSINTIITTLDKALSKVYNRIILKRVS